MATSSVQNEESTKVGVPSEACKRTEPLDLLQMLSNNLILIEKLRDGYHRHIIQYDVDIAAIEELVYILGNFKERLRELGDCVNYVNKLDGLEKCFSSFRGDSYSWLYNYFDFSHKKQSELFFKLREDNKNFQQLLEELKSLLTTKLSTFENAANDEKNKNVVSIIKQCFKDVPILKNFSRNIQYDHSTSVFIILEECLDLDDNLLAFWKSIDKDFTKEKTEKALLQLQMSVKKKKEQLLEDSKNENVEKKPEKMKKRIFQKWNISLNEDSKTENVEKKTREDEEKNLSKMEYFLECISKSFTVHSYALVDHEAVSSMCKKFREYDTSNFYPDILNFDVFKRSILNLKIELSNYNNYLVNYLISQKFNNMGSRRCNFLLHHCMREVATQLEDYQEDLNKKFLSQKKSGKMDTPMFEKIKTTLEKLKSLPGFLEEIKRILDEPTLLCIDLDKYLQFDDELLNYWNKLKQSSDDNRNKLLSLYSEIKKRKEIVLKERRIAEKLSHLELSGKNDGCQGKSLEVVD